MSEFIEPMHGTILSTAEVEPDRSVHQISIEMLPLHHAEHLVNFADKFGEGWFDSINKQLRLQFQLVILFGNEKAEELWISIPGDSKKIMLSPACSASPGAGQTYPQIPWSVQSRFVVNEIVSLPDWASGERFELMAGVAGKSVNIGVLHIGKAACNLKTVSTAATIETAEAVQAIDSSASKFLQAGIKRILGMDRLFLFTVVIPTLISCIYFGLIASDIYISESRFVVRSPQRQASSGLGALFQGAGFSRSQDDTYSVHDYIFSRDALKILDEQLVLGKEFSSSKVDIFSRFASLDWDNSFEALHRYYQKQVTLNLDSSSSISTLSVRAFSPELAYQINEKLLDMSETLVNQLNERGRRDMIRFAAEEVATAEQRAKAATIALAKIQTGSMKTADRDGALVGRLLETQQLTLEKEFADKMLAIAMNSLEQARSDAQHKQLYLERIVQPSKPDAAIEPRRMKNVIATLVLGLIAWGILTMLLAGVREHKD